MSSPTHTHTEAILDNRYEYIDMRGTTTPYAMVNATMVNSTMVHYECDIYYTFTPFIHKYQFTVKVFVYNKLF